MSEELDSSVNKKFMNEDYPIWYRLNNSMEFSTDIMPVIGGWLIRTQYDNHGDKKSGSSMVFVQDPGHDWDVPVISAA